MVLQLKKLQKIMFCLVVVVVCLKSPLQAQDSKTEIAVDTNFFMTSEGMKCWQVCQALSEYYNVNILVYDDVKEKKIYGDIQGVGIKQCLDIVAWQIGVEWLEQEKIYFIGGNRKNVVILDSFGLPEDINTVFKEVSVIGDKLAVVGTEREVKRVVDALKLLSNKSYVNVWLNVTEIVFDDTIELGIDWQKMIKYSFSWENLIKGQFNPIQSAVISFVASAKLEESYLDLNTLINTNIGVMSGSESSISATRDVDRQTFNESQYGERVVSGYNTQHSGLVVKVKGYRVKNDDWMFDVDLENSRAESDTVKRGLIFKNRVVCSPGQSVLIGIVKEKTESMSFEKGIPYISRIPYVGGLFSMHKTVNSDKRIILFLALEPSKGLNTALAFKSFLSLP